MKGLIIILALVSANIAEAGINPSVLIDGTKQGRLLVGMGLSTKNQDNIECRASLFGSGSGALFIVDALKSGQSLYSGIGFALSNEPNQPRGSNEIYGGATLCAGFRTKESATGELKLLVLENGARVAMSFGIIF